MAQLDLGIITVEPNEGSGNQTLTYKPKTENRGNRVAIEATIQATSPNVAPNPTQIVRLKAATEFVEFTDSEEISAPSAGGLLTITGRSNASKLNFTLGAGDLTIQAPSQYTAGGVLTNNNTEIEGDPGADAAYEFSVSINIPENTSLGSPTKQLIVTTTGNKTKTINIVQSAGEAYFRFTEEVVEVEQTGQVTSGIESNGTWTLSKVQKSR